ncbi:hypothetical protein SAMN05421505_12712 [Sinosporangium album]|uniref:DUF308 domain-containing protein n=1 Tax=Sinosporangium album TaxID=504805 RepID=A0A1G8GF71_9ACTN|nr:hypothetical protein [Sinosporangium album]SDH92980.1 hypothetical protein SAMN05421505_12712 [Sinosporangium album]
MTNADGRSGHTIVRQQWWSHLLLWLVFPLVGAGLGWLLPTLSDWLVGSPFEGPLKLIQSIPDPWLAVGAPIVGALLGLTVSAIALHEALVVTVADERVNLKREGRSLDFDRSAVSAAFVDAKHLVLLGHDGVELARERCDDLSVAELAAAFTGHGYRFLDEDPHKSEFRRWVPGMSGLPDGADAVLTARQKALDKGNSRDIHELREELSKIGVVVRQEKKRQYLRLAQGTPLPPGTPRS